MANQTFVIAGAGLAGAKSVEALREKGFDGQLILLGTEQHRPYERPALSKGYLIGSSEREKVFVHGPSWYADHDVDLRLGRTVSRIDRSAQRIELTGGESIDYGKLLLTTGASPRTLPVPGAGADNVHHLRTLEDSEALRERIAEVDRLVVIGAGWIGLEVTAAARQADVQVTVVETAELPLLAVLGPEAATVFADLHRDHGVDFRFGTSVAEITTDGGRATGVRLADADGTVIEADAVLVAIGASPNTALAEAAGLEVDNGIVVDASLRTSDPAVFAAGDVASAWHPLLKKQIRVEHWANALNQPATAAASMLGGNDEYSNLPYFFSDQYDLGMEYVGHVEPGGYDQVVMRGDVGKREFIAFWLSGGRVLAGMNVNVWDVTDPIKSLIRSEQVVDPSRLADPAVDLSDLTKGE
jgi:3-phenylpropionate/trans-cinnamate dioxygenase ferredoxin reductase subunit